VYRRSYQDDRSPVRPSSAGRGCLPRSDEWPVHFAEPGMEYQRLQPFFDNLLFVAGLCGHG
jgi:hypothetical protein